MTDIYSPAKNLVVAQGGPYGKINVGDYVFYVVQNCDPVAGPEAGERYTLRDGNRPQISVECTAVATAQNPTATFKEV
ncbi:hypothetical protein [Pseudomonas fontis]|uniref:Lipoprotein n=1 Tax=Pseudomonas fontis TaxID=2942633 RepID=A0ABT5P1F1_9PSED|nr:hypothetical protein [Pseudomonas fontis]MDD0975488.1 hypothetical protein [Pseudomonas fontis]MDD0994207.1 hypothetical protein [Pseudomonas fontis]